jgi:prophage regulatory protein
MTRLNKLYRLRDLSQWCGLKRTQIDELIAKGEFPRPIKLSDSGRAIAWLEADLAEWQAKRIAARDAEAPKTSKRAQKAT